MQLDSNYDGLPKPLSKQRATRLALAVTFLLTFAKFFVALLTGSVSILSEAFHSGLDLLSSLMTFFVVRAAGKPADENHPFGHGKMESLSALFEAFLLLIAAFYILYESTMHLLTSGSHIQNTEFGLVVIGVSIGLNLVVYFQNKKVATEFESIAIETNAYHFLTDVFSSIAVFIGIAIVHFTGLIWVDSVTAILVAFYIFWIGIEQIKKCLDELADTALPGHELAQVEAVLQSELKRFLGYHDLKTRKVGSVRHIEFHLTACTLQKVGEAHAICDDIEEKLGALFREVHVNIHVEPCTHHDTKECDRGCALEEKR